MFEYLREVARVCAVGDHLVFDCFTEEEFTPAMIDKWLSVCSRYPVVIPRACILGYLSARSFQLLREFSTKYGVGVSRYFIMHKP